MYKGVMEYWSKLFHYSIIPSFLHLSMLKYDKRDRLLVMITKEICSKSAIEMLMQPGLYRWCACGLSNTQPFCDDSHYGTGIEPMNVRFDEEKVVIWCTCKKSSTNPFCDGIGLKQ